MTHACEVCGKSYKPRNKTQRFCGSTCRQRGHRGQQGRPKKAAVTPEQPPTLVESVRSRLADLNQADTALGEQALVMAELLTSAVTGHASISKELSRLLDEAAAAAPAAKDPIDELRERRERRLASA